MQNQIVEAPQASKAEIHEPHATLSSQSKGLKGVPSMSASYENNIPSFAGFATGPLTPEIRKAMKIQTDKQIAKVVSFATYPGLPADYFCKDPCGQYGNLFQINKFTPAYVEWKPINFELVDINVKSMMVDQTLLRNTTDIQQQQEATLHMDITNTTESSWSQGTSIGVGVQASTAVNIGFVHGDVTISTNVETSFGKSETVTESITIGKTQTARATLPPHTVYRARLDVSRGTAKGKITYEAQLKGKIVCYHMASTYGLPVENYLPEQNRKARFEQILDISAYSRGTITIEDV